MADSNIGALPQAAQLDDDSLLVAEQQGQAVKVTGQQFKEFGRQAVVGQVQGYVDAAQKAAAEAVDAVSAVTGMTVEANASQTASVDKSMKNGKVHLTFGLPRGEQGVPGPEGPAGPRGARGETGRGLDILGYYPDQEALERAVTAPEAGDAYGVGTEAPYDICVFDSVTQAWKNNGPLSGGGGIVPENVVTCEGGAALEIPETFGDAPHVITFDEEEEAPLAASDIAYGEESVKEALDGLFTCVSDGKALIASAVTDKGVPTEPDASFADMAEHIGQISGGGDTSDATATPGDILAGKTAYTASGKAEGIIPTLPARTYTPSTQPQTIANGQYLGGTQTIQGDPNLTSGNIKKGVSIFGVAGAVEQSFLATLTVTADVGAVVTATHTSGTEVEALSTTGTVTLELPLEGQWTVTARRGVAQYNSVVVTVSSQYSAALTAEVHIEYYGTATNLQTARSELTAAANDNYALFAGGSTKSSFTTAVDAYSKTLTRTIPSYRLGEAKYRLAATGNRELVVFAGGAAKDLATGVVSYLSSVDGYNGDLAHITYLNLSVARERLAGTSVGSYIIFGGGRTANGGNNAVDAYLDSATRFTPTGLSLPASGLAAASNDSYALFGGGSSGPNDVTAYDAKLTRTVAPGLSVSRYDLTAARAGNYVLFAGGGSVVEAYDLFLTRTTAEKLEVGRWYLCGTTVGDYALFAGGTVASGPLANALDTVDAYDPFLVHTTPKVLKERWSQMGAAAVDKFALFGGGYRYLDQYNEYYSDAVYVYQYV